MAFFTIIALSDSYNLINGSDRGFPGFCADRRLEFYSHDPGYRMDILVSPAG
jgi:hypothetical protein